jgi:hypothetical protein
LTIFKSLNILPSSENDVLPEMISRHCEARYVAVIPAKLVLDPDRGAGIWIPDKPCGLSGMTTEGYSVDISQLFE